MNLVLSLVCNSPNPNSVLPSAGYGRCTCNLFLSNHTSHIEESPLQAQDLVKFCHTQQTVQF